MGVWGGGDLVVAEDAFAEGVGVGDDGCCDEEEHAAEEKHGEAGFFCGGAADGAEVDGPRVEEDDFDVEEQESHCDNEETNVEAAT